MNNNFDKVLSLLEAFNRLHDGISLDPMYEPVAIDGILYVRGLSENLAKLYTLLHASTFDYAFYLVECEHEMVMKVLNLH